MMPRSSSSIPFELSPYDPKKFTVFEVPGDGDCAYHSVIRSIRELYPHIDIPNTPKEVRRLMIRKVSSDDLSLFPIDLQSPAKSAERKQVIRRIKMGISQEGHVDSWAQNEEFTILSNLFNICIAVWSQAMSLWIYILPNSIDNKSKGLEGCLSVIYLFNVGELAQCDQDEELYNQRNCGSHFNFMIPRSKSTRTTPDDQDADADEGEEDVDQAADEGEEEDLESKNYVDKKEVQFIRSASLKERFAFFKKKIEQLNKSKNFEGEIYPILSTAAAMKPPKRSHRLREFADYFVNDELLSELNPTNQFFYTKKQKFLKKFLSIDTNNMSILLFHDVGVGKTCSSILIAENFINIFDKKILVLLPSSLETNYKKELFDSSKLNYTNRSYDACSGRRYLDQIPDWHKMSRHDVNKKIQNMIKDDYSFYGYTKIVNVIEKIKSKALKLYPHDRAMRIQHEFWTIRETFSNRVMIIDEIHNIRMSTDRSLKKFPKVLKRILKFSENIRLVLLSATPMFDKPEEFSWLMDFIYTADQKHMAYSTKIEFNAENKLTASSVKNLQYFSKNYVSYMRGYNPKTFPIKHFVEDPLSHLYTPTLDMITQKPLDYTLSTVTTDNHDEYKFVASRMRGVQLEQYKAYTRKKTHLDSNIQQAIQISNIAFPQKDEGGVLFGQTGFFQNFKVHDSEKQIQVSYINPTTPFLHMDHISRYSSKFYDILNNIQQCTGLVLVYSRYLFSGVVSLGIALEHLGYKKYKSKNILRSNEAPKQHSYIILTADYRFSPANESELEVFNSEANSRGSLIKVALINDIAAEGVTFKNVREIHILEPWYNMYKIQQIVGRGVRFKSHADLPEQERNVSIYMYINTVKGSVETVDYRRYRQALHKQDRIKQVEAVLKSHSLDCVFNDVDNNAFDTEVVDSKGKQRSIRYSPAEVTCATHVDPPSHTYNKRLIMLDVFELGKRVKQIVEAENLYSFTFKYMHAKTTRSSLLKITLDYMISNKVIIVLNNTQGHLICIPTQEMYVFQPLNIDDPKISVYDRSKPERKHIKRFLLTDDETNLNENDNPTVRDRENSLEHVASDLFAKYMSQIFGDKRADAVNEQIVMDMAVDHSLSATNITHALSVKHPLITKSLARGFVTLTLEDGQPIVFDFFSNKALCPSSNNHDGLLQPCGIKQNQKVVNYIKSKLPKSSAASVLGFIDVLKKERTTSKIIHRDPNRRSSGSACITTSSFKIDILQDLIRSLDPKVHVESLQKRSLCLLYEYTLRNHQNFLRPIPHLFGRQ